MLSHLILLQNVCLDKEIILYTQQREVNNVLGREVRELSSSSKNSIDKFQKNHFTSLYMFLCL